MASLTHHWIRKLTESRKPAYLLIPELIEEDLASGRLRPRDRLPGLRDLADELQLNYTTVARAYAEARKRGLLDSRAGSGTFVRGLLCASHKLSKTVKPKTNGKPSARQPLSCDSCWPTRL